MNIKTLLLGSAAVMVAVSGARAADAIVIEPEPVEYVRVCDAYGAGWWYIPGTETCIKFDGEVRVQYDVTHYHDDLYTIDVAGNILPNSEETSYHDADYRAQLNVRANNETEYGTLSSRIRLEAASASGGHDDQVSSSEGPGSADAVVNVATISLAGFEIGYGDSYWNRAGGFGYYNARFDGFTNGHTGLYFDYTYAANGFTATVGIEDGNDTGEAGSPDVYGGVTYTAGGLSLAGLAYYDGSASEAAYRLRADYDMSSIAPGLAVGGWYTWDGGDTDYVKGHVWGVTAKVNLVDNLVLFGGYSVYADQFDDTGQTVPGLGAVVFPSDVDRSAENWTVGVSWTPVPGLLIQPEYTATSYDEEIPLIFGTSTTPFQANSGTFSLRIVRSF